MAVTASGIYYPDPGSRPNGRLQMQALAESVETVAGGTRKAVEIATAQNRNATTFGYLSTPDQITGVVIPAKAILRVRYQALWKTDSGGNISQAAIFVGSNQLKISDPLSSNPLTQAAVSFPSQSYHSLITSPGGLSSYDYSGTDQVMVTTGQAQGAIMQAHSVAINDVVRTLGSGAWSATNAVTVNGPYGGGCDIFAIAPGTYTVGIQFKTESGGNLIVKNRYLYVEVIKFA